MVTLSQVCCFLTTFFVIQKQTFAFTCGINKSEIVSAREGSFTNITYLLNATKSSASPGSTTLVYQVCDNNSLTIQCEVEWTEGSSQPSLERWGPGDDVVCSYEPRYLDNTMVTWEIKVSQLVSRSLSVMQLYLENKTHNKKTKKIIRQIHIDVRYPAQVTSLTVDGQEVNGTRLINDSQKVSVSCSFEKGNPPVAFSLVDNNGRELVRGSRPLTYSPLVHCEDDWPTVRCEGNGSEQNRSVSFLVTCPPKFTENSVKIISSPSLNITLAVKSYTKEFDTCQLTTVTLGGNKTITLNCTLTGHPPHLTLSSHLNNEDNRIQGLWMLQLLNNKGPTNTTLNFTKESRMRFKNESENPAQARGKEIVIGVACGTVVMTVVVVGGICAVRIVKKRKNGSRGGNAQNETTNGNEGERTSKKSDSSTSSPGQAAGNGSKSGGSTPRSSSSGSDKPSTNPNYTSTALQEVEIHPYMDLHTRDPTYASTTSSKDPHMYMELKTLKAESKSPQQGSGRNGNDGYETPRVPGQGNQSSDGYETPQPPREERRRSALYANQGRSDEPIQEEVNYYNEA